MKQFRKISIFVLILILGTIAVADEYTDSCASYVKKLSYAAEEYDSAKLDFESAKSAFESACDPYYGYSKGNESACGVYGYERSSLESAANSLKNAAAELEYALDRVNKFCGTCQNSCKTIQAAADLKIKKLNLQIIELNQKIQQLESTKKPPN